MAEFATDDGVRIVYDDIGARDGTPVVICHGIVAGSLQMAADAAWFARHGYRVIVPNLRGHGPSGRPEPLTREALSIRRLATDLVAMLDHAGVGPVHWVGNSLGGIVALDMLSAHEARFRTLATFGTAYALRLPRWPAAVVPLGYALCGRRLLSKVGSRLTTHNPAARPLLEQLVRESDPLVVGALAWNLATYDLIDNASRASLPILMLRGGRDGPVNAALRPTLAAMRMRPNFTLVELPDGGHCANLDATDAWRAALLEFWRQR